MDQRVVLQHSQNGRRADAVVGTQRRTVGRHPIAVDVGIDGVREEVEILVVVLLRHHVEVGLENDSLAVFHAGRRRLAHVDVVRLVLAALQAQGPGDPENVFADFLLVRRGPRDADDLGKMFPDERRFQRGQISIHSSAVLKVFFGGPSAVRCP